MLYSFISSFSLSLNRSMFVRILIFIRLILVSSFGAHFIKHSMESRVQFFFFLIMIFLIVLNEKRKWIQAMTLDSLKHYPAGTWRLYNVVLTSIQRHDVASTLRRRCIDAMRLCWVFLQYDVEKSDIYLVWDACKVCHIKGKEDFTLHLGKIIDVYVSTDVNVTHLWRATVLMIPLFLRNFPLYIRILLDLMVPLSQ